MHHLAVFCFSSTVPRGSDRGRRNAPGVHRFVAARPMQHPKRASKPREIFYASASLTCTFLARLHAHPASKDCTFTNADVLAGYIKLFEYLRQGGTPPNALPVPRRSLAGCKLLSPEDQLFRAYPTRRGAFDAPSLLASRSLSRGDFSRARPPHYPDVNNCRAPPRRL